MNGTGVVDDPSDPYDGKSTLGGLPYLGPGYGDSERSDAVVILKCPDTGGPVVWTTDEQFNEQRSTERIGVGGDDATVGWGGGWKCPGCGEYHPHDVGLAQGADPEELRELAEEIDSAGGNA